ncbi:hypothetical protein CUPS4256_09055 [Campylobacter upsaliensis]|uniref:hypothetical protein n=1 Tax=Campylobacter upsaliensis TaxID=28080 RepID=UPI00214A5C3B|nr:hypothetical protein [Campylobacter upsaliensis]MCR2103383.1 hypothetical protein [Campylobacter upsaliensis]
MRFRLKVTKAKGTTRPNPADLPNHAIKLTTPKAQAVPKAYAFAVLSFEFVKAKGFPALCFKFAFQENCKN